MTESRAVAYFDSVAEVYDVVLPFFATQARVAADRLVGAGLLGPGTRVLDVGAGRGALSAEALARGAAVIAVDAAPSMVACLRRDHPGLDARVMDAATLDLPDASFDLVTAGFVLHLLPGAGPDPADPVTTSAAESAVAEIRRVLAPGGSVALVVPGRADGSPDPWPDPLLDIVSESRRTHAVSRLGSDVDEEELLVQAGFAQVELATIEVDLPVPDGETYWRWLRSYGGGSFVEALGEEARADLRSRLVAACAAGGDVRLRRSATLITARRP